MAYDAAVVGSGFSAIAVTINLLRLLPPAASIAVVGDDPGFGRGTAYRTEFHIHRLNVPASRMSVFPDEPDDFVAWLNQRGRQIAADGFASRGDYGLYLRDRLASLLRGGNRKDSARIDFIKAKAEDCLRCDGGGLVFRLDNGDDLRARNVVLCLGVGNADLPLKADRIDPKANNRIIRNPWRLSWLPRVGHSDPVCILGSGLTMIDQVLALRMHGHRGSIHVLSRRGLLPHAHARERVAPVSPDLSGPRDISALLNALRRQVREGADWRGLMDGLRPTTQSLWQELTRDQRSRFLRHALAWWNIHRHRVAPAVFARFDGLVQNGTVLLHAGFLQAIEIGPAGPLVCYRRRGSHEQASFRADWIVNCTGMERAGIAHSPLLKAMRTHGMIAADELGLGLMADEHSRVLAGNAEPQPGLYAVGALTAGQFWEITAVPDIRVQARDVAAAVTAAHSPRNA